MYQPKVKPNTKLKPKHTCMPGPRPLLLFPLSSIFQQSAPPCNFCFLLLSLQQAVILVYFYLSHSTFSFISYFIFFFLSVPSRDFRAFFFNFCFLNWLVPGDSGIWIVRFLCIWIVMKMHVLRATNSLCFSWKFKF